MAFDLKPPDRVPIKQRRAIRRAIQDRIVAEIAARNSAHGGQFVSTPDGYVIELPHKRRVPLSDEEQALLKQAFDWEKTGEGPSPKTRQ